MPGMDASLLWPPGLLLVGTGIGFVLRRHGWQRVFRAVAGAVLAAILGLPALLGLLAGGWLGRAKTP